MSSAPNQAGGQQLTREAALVARIIARTAQGRITWHKLPSSVTAMTANGMRFDFILNAPILVSAQTWVTFTVRDQTVEVLKVQKTLIPVMMTPAATQLERLVDQLFNVAVGKAQDTVDRAIAKLDQL